jgi:hypothetical protein
MITDTQRELCDHYGVECDPPSYSQKLGIALNVKTGLQPINGLRHRTAGDTSGWYIWSGGELSQDSGFFVPLHHEHLVEWCPAIEKFLGLPAGWRFLKGRDYEDVWYDASLLDVASGDSL